MRLTRRRHLKSKGIPAVSLGLGMISEIGYLHENPEIEALLLRRGIQAIDADELIQLIDLALSSKTMGIHHAHDALAACHFLTGLEAFGLKELRKKGFEGSLPTMDDPRAGNIAGTIDADGGTQRFLQKGSHPAEVAKGLESGETLPDAVLDHIRRRFGNLVLMKSEAVDTGKSLAEYGIDSMIGAEFRTWFYQSFTVDISLLMLLGKTCSLQSFKDLVVADLETRVN